MELPHEQDDHCRDPWNPVDEFDLYVFIYVNGEEVDPDAMFVLRPPRGAARVEPVSISRRR